MNYEPFTSIKNHLIIFNLSALIRVICGWRYSTTVESSLQIDLFMQNKPNFPKSQMNANTFTQMAYENKRDWTIGQSKPNSNPIKPNLVRRRRIPKMPKWTKACLPQRIMKMKPPSGPKKQTQSKPVLSAVEWANFKRGTYLLTGQSGFITMVSGKIIDKAFAEVTGAWWCPWSSKPVWGW